MVQNTKSGGGRTLINGTAYEIGFAPKSYTLTIKDGDSLDAYALYNGTRYPSGTLEIPAGESVTIYANSSGSAQCAVYINGKFTESDYALRYIYAPSQNATISFDAYYASGWIYDVYITEG